LLKPTLIPDQNYLIIFDAMAQRFFEQLTQKIMNDDELSQYTK